VTAPLPYRIRRIGMRKVLRAASGAVSWGQTGLAAMREAGLPDATPAVLCASRPPNPQNFPHSPLPDEVTPLRVAYGGRLVKVKGVQTLIDAIDALSPSSVNVRVLGDGPFRGSLEALAHDKNVAIEFMGTGSERDVADLFRWAHVVVVPTLVSRRYSEQWGRIAVEAIMCGRAVIASDSGELPFIVGDPEMVFPHGDSSLLASVIQRLADDRKLLEVKTTSSSERAPLFAPSAQADDLIGLWRDVSENPR